MAPAIDLRGHGTESQEAERVLTVLVTGFGPFQEKYPVNPSYEIARLLPTHLPSSPDHKTAVRIISYGSPIRVAYDEVRALVPKLHDQYKGTVDLVLHIGMAAGRDHYTLEQYAHRDGFDEHKDLDDKLPPLAWSLDFFDGCPEVMTSSLDYPDILRRLQTNINRISEGADGREADCRPSSDAGHFLCDYIYLNSLVYFARRSGSFEGGETMARPVLFLHVPAESDERMLRQGSAVAIALIGAMVDSCGK